MKVSNDTVQDVTTRTRTHLNDRNLLERDKTINSTLESYNMKIYTTNYI